MTIEDNQLRQQIIFLLKFIKKINYEFEIIYEFQMEKVTEIQ